MIILLPTLTHGNPLLWHNSYAFFFDNPSTFANILNGKRKWKGINRTCFLHLHQLLRITYNSGNTFIRRQSGCTEACFHIAVIPPHSLLSAAKSPPPKTFAAVNSKITFIHPPGPVCSFHVPYRGIPQTALAKNITVLLPFPFRGFLF